MKSSSFLKNSVKLHKPMEKPYTDYQINLVKSEIKPKKFLFRLHAFLVIIWLFTMTMNFFNSSYFAATLNLLCVFCWLILSKIGYDTLKSLNLKLTLMLEENNKVDKVFEKEKKEFDSLDFFKKQIQT